MKVLDVMDQLVTFEIWSPKYSTKTVLLAKSRVDEAKTKHFKIVFTKAPSMTGDWYVNRNQVKKCLVSSNGTIQVYNVPLKFLEPLTITESHQYTLW